MNTTTNQAAKWAALGAAADETDIVDLPLPSGMTIRARRPGITRLAYWGLIPLQLMAAIAEGQDSSSAAAARADRGEVFAHLAAKRDLLIYCVVEPRISMTPGPGEIHPRDIPEADMDFLLAWGQRAAEVADLSRFRAQRSIPAVGSDGGSIPQPAQPDAGDPRSGDRDGSGQCGGVPAPPVPRVPVDEVRIAS
jgi:hypothetical protein